MRSLLLLLTISGVVLAQTVQVTRPRRETASSSTVWYPTSTSILYVAAGIYDSYAAGRGQSLVGPLPANYQGTNYNVLFYDAGPGTPDTGLSQLYAHSLYGWEMGFMNLSTSAYGSNNLCILKCGVSGLDASTCMASVVTMLMNGLSTLSSVANRPVQLRNLLIVSGQNQAGTLSHAQVESNTISSIVSNVNASLSLTNLRVDVFITVTNGIQPYSITCTTGELAYVTANLAGGLVTSNVLVNPILVDGVHLTNTSAILVGSNYYNNAVSKGP